MNLIKDEQEYCVWMKSTFFQGCDISDIFGDDLFALMLQEEMPESFPCICYTKKSMQFGEPNTAHYLYHDQIVECAGLMGLI